MYEPTLKSGHIPVLIATRPFRGPTILHSEYPPHVTFETQHAYCFFSHNRHRRIHEAQQDGQQPLSTHEEDLENEENDFGSADEDFSPQDPSLPTSMVNMTSMATMPAMTMPPMHTMVAPNMIAPQLLQQQI